MNKLTTFAIAMMLSAAVKAHDIDVYDLYQLESKPGSTNTLLLDFDGRDINNSKWNKGDRHNIVALSMFGKGFYAEFTQYELNAMWRIWELVSERLVGIDVNVTLADPLYDWPVNMSIVVITKALADDGLCIAKCNADSQSYYNKFGLNQYDKYRPAFIYADNLKYDPYEIANAIVREFTNELGLRQ